jgi:hypothetical protein
LEGLIKKNERPFVRPVAYTGKHSGGKGRSTFMHPVKLEVTMPVFDLPLEHQKLKFANMEFYVPCVKG